MVERTGWMTWASHALLILGVATMALPLWVAFVASTLTQGEIVHPPMPLWPGSHFWENWRAALLIGSAKGGIAPVSVMMANSLVMALLIAVGKIAISLLSAFAIVYFRFRFRMLCFWTIFVTLMLPVEVRIVPTYAVAAGLGLLDSHLGLALPLIASATATFLFRQFFLTVPDELVEAARIDGAGPWAFLKDVLLPLSRTNIAALFVILFIYGWNQYLWPLLITTKPDMATVVMGISQMLPRGDQEIEWPVIMAAALLAMTPPVLVVVVLQRWFVRGLIDSEK
ncbi:MAG: sn-glycerol-3-phosphate ABC transporter permease UgpE [Azospirillum sp.]|nr:sn-glycerol-3-phosphate ABC transporter permease UgpE [Azospirillum sp.]